MSSFLGKEKKKKEWHNLVGNPIVPSVWRKNQKANSACPSLDLEFPKDSVKFKNLERKVFL